MAAVGVVIAASAARATRLAPRLPTFLLAWLVAASALAEPFAPAVQTETDRLLGRLAISGSSMSGQRYLVRRGNGAPVQSGQWLRSQLQDMRSAGREKSTP
ncbi:MAG: hypothetical protein IT521_13200 [Burkholderiales bacterium]|nr:hypothetical protein [Burkholderiales bacterium]